jgi:hypothetical protein
MFFFRAIAIGCVLGAYACGGASNAAPPSEPVRPPPTPAVVPVNAMASSTRAPTPTKLGQSRSERLRIAQENLAPALASWKLAELGTDCTLVFDEHDEWLVGCDFSAPPKGFDPTSESVRTRAVLWNGSPLTLGETTTPYEKAKLGLVGTVTSREDGGTKSPVLVVQEWDALHANHPAFRDSGIEEWFGIVVHEAFHAHQMWHPRILGLVEHWNKNRASSEDLATYVKKDAEYRAAVDSELDHLREAVDGAHDPKAARAGLALWLKDRQRRQSTFEKKMDAAMPDKHAWEMDGFYTFLEGTARYVEARFLMAPMQSTMDALAKEPTFRRFEATRGKKPTELPGLSKGGPKYVYAIGMYVSFLLDLANPKWKERVFENDGLLVAEAERAASGR